MDDRFENFVISITEVHRYLQKIKEVEMERMGLKAGHTMCLYILGKHPEGLTATQLTELCKEDKAAISRTLSHLSEMGMVTYELSANKRSYRTIYHLTHKGQETVDRIEEKVREVLEKGGSGLTKGQREDLYISLEQICDNLAEFLNESREKE